MEKLSQRGRFCNFSSLWILLISPDRLFQSHIPQQRKLCPQLSYASSWAHSSKTNRKGELLGRLSVWRKLERPFFSYSSICGSSPSQKVEVIKLWTNFRTSKKVHFNFGFKTGQTHECGKTYIISKPIFLFSHQK